MVAFFVLILGGMFAVFIGVFYAITLWGGLAGLLVGGLGVAGAGGGFAAYYVVGVMQPASRGLNLSSQVFESSSWAWGCWVVNDTPMTEIPMDDKKRKMPVRIPVGMYERRKENVNGGQLAEQTSQPDETGIDMIEEIRVRCPEKECPSKGAPFLVDSAEVSNKLPYLTFDTYAYVATPSQRSVPFKQAVIISPCPIDELRRIQDLIFYNGFPVMAPTTYVSLTRVFELDEHDPTFYGPVYFITFSTWHVQLTQKMTSFIPAYMVPNQEQIVNILNLWGFGLYKQLSQQYSTTSQRAGAVENQLSDFQGQVLKTSWNIFAQFLRTREMPKLGGSRIPFRNIALLIVAAVVISLVAGYLLHLI